MSVAPVLDKLAAPVALKQARRPSDACPWCNGFEYSHQSTALCLHREILDFARWIAPTKEERHLRHLVIERFRNSVKLLWPSALVVCHGSSATNTYLPGSDIDFVVHLDTAEAAPKLLHDLNEHLAALQLFRFSEVLESAKCPIIKGVEKPFGFHVDIAINNDNGILNIERNRRVMEAYPALFPLLMFLKFFLFQNRLDEPYHGGISSNTLQNMIVFVIQASTEENKTNLGKLLISFFKTFGTTFNYITTGISTRCGGRLFSRIDLDRVNWKTPVCLCIEDPQIPGRFLGENCYECCTFRSKCHVSYKRVMSDGPVDEQSMLLRVISKPEWIIRKRDELSKQYQALLGNAVECFSLAMDEEDMRRANKGHRNSRGKGDDRRRRREDRPYTR